MSELIKDLLVKQEITRNHTIIFSSSTEKGGKIDIEIAEGDFLYVLHYINGTFEKDFGKVINVYGDADTCKMFITLDTSTQNNRNVIDICMNDVIDVYRNVCSVPIIYKDTEVISLIVDHALWNTTNIDNEYVALVPIPLFDDECMIVKQSVSVNNLEDMKYLNGANIMAVLDDDNNIELHSSLPLHELGVDLSIDIHFIVCPEKVEENDPVTPPEDTETDDPVNDNTDPTVPPEDTETDDPVNDNTDPTVPPEDTEVDTPAGDTPEDTETDDPVEDDSNETTTE